MTYAHACCPYIDTIYYVLVVTNIFQQAWCTSHSHIQSCADHTCKCVMQGDSTEELADNAVASVQPAGSVKLRRRQYRPKSDIT